MSALFTFCIHQVRTPRDCYKLTLKEPKSYQKRHFDVVLLEIIVMQVVSVVAVTQLIHKLFCQFCKQKVGNLAVLGKKSGKMRG